MARSFGPGEDDASRTMFLGAREAQGRGDVYQVTTQSRTYLLSVERVGGRRFAVLQGAPGSGKEDFIVRDSDPRIGELLLWDVPDERQWVGQPLTVATVTTTRVANVIREPGSVGTQVAVAAPAKAIVTGARATSQGASKDANVRPPTPYPESHVEYAEDAAMLLRAVARKDRLFDDVAEVRFLAERLAHAIKDCVLSLERLRSRWER